MNLSDYVADLHRLLQSHPLIAWYDLDAQSRGERFLFLRRKVEFLHHTILDFKEFVECHPDRIERFKYAYNCRQDNRVLFRYDKPQIHEPNISQPTLRTNTKAMRSGHLLPRICHPWSKKSSG